MIKTTIYFKYELTEGYKKAVFVSNKQSAEDIEHAYNILFTKNIIKALQVEHEII